VTKNKNAAKESVFFIVVDIEFGNVLPCESAYLSTK